MRQKRIDRLGFVSQDLRLIGVCRKVFDALSQQLLHPEVLEQIIQEHWIHGKVVCAYAFADNSLLTPSLNR